MKVQVTQDIDYMPYTVLRRGETGEIVEHYEDLGEVDVKMDEYHEGLDMWRNVAHLAPPETAYIEPVSVATVAARRLFSWGKVTHVAKLATAAAVAALVIVAVVMPLHAADTLIEVNEFFGRDYEAWTHYENLRAKDVTLWSARKSCLTTNETPSGDCYRRTDPSKS